MLRDTHCYTISSNGTDKSLPLFQILYFTVFNIFFSYGAESTNQLRRARRHQGFSYQILIASFFRHYLKRLFPTNYRLFEFDLIRARPFSLLGLPKVRYHALRTRMQFSILVHYFHTILKGLLLFEGYTHEVVHVRYYYQNPPTVFIFRRLWFMAPNRCRFAFEGVVCSGLTSCVTVRNCRAICLCGGYIPEFKLGMGTAILEENCSWHMCLICFVYSHCLSLARYHLLFLSPAKSPGIQISIQTSSLRTAPTKHSQIHCILSQSVKLITTFSN
ncbi:hypothetical protein BT63DRAFT_75143 [Microthyrium microscopicum]|uniref:Uncharacterized protein n=1 Tax=Microthyrium microscopicum TaxID=703497 RepID=A0A6A6U0Y0_9PEZI|nr:hypothetical protein BT63DRAFT_75143 [Microthyrium microscopicum]